MKKTLVKYFNDSDIVLRQFEELDDAESFQNYTENSVVKKVFGGWGNKSVWVVVVDDQEEYEKSIRKTDEDLEIGKVSQSQDEVSLDKSNQENEPTVQELELVDEIKVIRSFEFEHSAKVYSKRIKDSSIRQNKNQRWEVIQNLDNDKKLKIRKAPYTYQKKINLKTLKFCPKSIKKTKSSMLKKNQMSF